MPDRAENISALILAAGASSRMGSFKPLLPLENEPVIARVAGIFRTAGIADIRVVTGFAADRLIPVLANLGLSWTVNDDYSRGMFSSIQAGVRALGRDCRAFFLLPADMPFVRPATVGRLLAAFEQDGEGADGKRSVVYRPHYGGRRGHPLLITAALIPEILAFSEPGGLRVLLARLDRGIVDIECDDPGILIDLDTPEDYRRGFQGG